MKVTQDIAFNFGIINFLKWLSGIKAKIKEVHFFKVFLSLYFFLFSWLLGKNIWRNGKNSYRP